LLLLLPLFVFFFCCSFYNHQKCKPHHGSSLLLRIHLCIFHY
jgi:hypothetical protein